MWPGSPVQPVARDSNCDFNWIALLGHTLLSNRSECSKSIYKRKSAGHISPSPTIYFVASSLRWIRIREWKLFSVKWPSIGASDLLSPRYPPGNLIKLLSGEHARIFYCPPGIEDRFYSARMTMGQVGVKPQMCLRLCDGKGCIVDGYDRKLNR